jgi:hypothetical protein
MVCHDRQKRNFSAKGFDRRGWSGRRSLGRCGNGWPTPALAAKVSQKSVRYQDTPKGEQRCDNCALFEAPSSCKTVEGPVAPEGWCMVYAKKQV